MTKNATNQKFLDKCKILRLGKGRVYLNVWNHANLNLILPVTQLIILISPEFTTETWKS